MVTENRRRRAAAAKIGQANLSLANLRALMSRYGL
jgi:hypothetical protein